MKQKYVNIILIVFLILSVIAIYLIKFLLAEIPEKCDFGYEIGEVLYNLSLAYISSCIFYLLVVLIPQNRNKKNIYKHASSISEGIVINGSRIFEGLKYDSGVFNLDTELSEKDFLQLCRSISPNDIQTFFLTSEKQYPITYLEHINKLRLSVRNDIQTLFTYIAHLETEHIKIINDILYCQLMTNLNPYFTDKKYSKHNTSFEPIEYALYQFYKEIRILKDYNSKK